MKKSIFILALMLIGFSSCTQENEFEGSDLSLGRFEVSADFIDLSVDKSNQLAGTITVNSNNDEVKVEWISDPSFNIDTTQTSISMNGGKGILPVKWLKMLENGTYIPDNILFKAGVVLSAGEDKKYIPLYNVQKLDSAKVAENINTRTSEPIDDKVYAIEFIPPVVNMGENGATLLVRLTNISQALVDYSAIKSNHNIDMDETNLPAVLTVPQNILKFNWKNPAIRPAAFSLSVPFYAFELTNSVNATLVWAPAESNITVTPEEHNVAHAGGAVASLVTCNTSWVANKAAEDWFTMTPVNGEGNGTINFNVSANTGEARSATVTVTAGNVSKQIVINQVAQSDVLTVEPINHSVTNAGGIVTSTITSNTSWTATKGSEDWFTMTPASGSGNGSIAFTVSPNNSISTRTATVTVTSGSITKQITITQAAQDISLSVDPASHSVTNAGGTVTSTITSNTSWTATKGSEDWFTMTPASGSGNGSIAFTVSPNNSISTRTATVTVTSGSITKQITITQAAQDISLSVDPASHSVAHTGGTVSSSVTSNTSWNVTISDSWLHANVLSGTNNGTISFTVDANNTTNSRTATATITTSAAGIAPITRTIVFTQGEGVKPVNPGGITVDDIGGAEDIIINGGSL